MALSPGMVGVDLPCKSWYDKNNTVDVYVMQEV